MTHGMLTCLDCRVVFPFHQLPVRSSVKKPLCRQCSERLAEVKRKRARQRQS